MLITHDSQLPELLAWAEFNQDILAQCDVYATGPTCRKLMESLDIKIIDFPGALFSDASEPIIDLLIILWDFSEPLPDDPPTKTLLQIVMRGNIPIAANRAAAYYMFPSYLAPTNHEDDNSW